MTLAELIAQKSNDVATVVEIYMPARGGTNTEQYWYASDRPYRTRSTDSPADTQFTPCIESVPRYSVTLPEPGAPRASVSFGAIQLSSPFLPSHFLFSSVATFDPDSDIRTDVWPGAQITVKQVGPRKKYTYAEAVTLFSGRVESVGSNNTGGVTINVTGASNKDLDFRLTGPRIYGRVKNFTPKLENFGALTYGLNGGDEIEAINGVFDRANVIPTPAGYTPDLADGELSLTAEADQLTVDADGGKLSGTWAESTKDIVELIVSQTDSELVLSDDWDLLTDRIGYAIQVDEIKTLEQIFDELARSHLGFWWIDDSGELTFRKWTNSDAVAATYTKNQVFDFEWEYFDRTYTAATFQRFYGKNWTPGQSPVSGATNARAVFSQAEYDSSTIQTTPGITGSAQIDPPPNLTLFAANANSTVWADLYRHLARRYTITVPLDSPRKLADRITFWTDEGDKTGFCMGRTITLDGATPVQQLTLMVAT